LFTNPIDIYILKKVKTILETVLDKVPTFKIVAVKLEKSFVVNGKSKDDFLFSVKAMSYKYRGCFVSKLRKALPQLPQSLYDNLFKTAWVVF